MTTLKEIRDRISVEAKIIAPGRRRIEIEDRSQPDGSVSTRYDTSVDLFDFRPINTLRRDDIPRNGAMSLAVSEFEGSARYGGFFSIVGNIYLVFHDYTLVYCGSDSRVMRALVK